MVMKDKRRVLSKGRVEYVIDGFMIPSDATPEQAYQIIQTEAKRRRDLMATVQPKIVCLCGSTRFSEEFQQANLRETLAGHIVLTIGCDMKSDTELFDGYDNDQLSEVKQRLDALHLRKIDLADEIFVINRYGYVGESTWREIVYAMNTHKEIRWLEPDLAVASWDQALALRHENALGALKKILEEVELARANMYVIHTKSELRQLFDETITELINIAKIGGVS